MRGLRAWTRRLTGFVSPGRTERELAAEIQSHLELHIDDNIRAGMTPAEARRAALIKFGPVEALKDEYRDRSSLPLFDSLMRDVRFAARTLLRRPGFAAAAATTLALGIGANTAVFSVVDAVLLQPLPYPAPERVVEVRGPGQSFVRFGPVFEVSPRELRESSAFDAIGFYIAGGANLGGAPAVRVRGAAVDPGFFASLGVSPLIGRTFTDEDIAASGSIVLISHRLWRERLLANPDVVGRTVTLDGAAFTVVGVMPAGLAFPLASDVWVPTNAPTKLKGMIPTPRLVARLAAGVTTSQARAEILRLARFSPAKAASVSVLPMREALVRAVRPVAIVIWIAAGLVLLIACINAANLLLARVSSREREFAVRRALGASGGQLMRQVLVESAVLAAVGAALAIPAARWTIEAARVLLPMQLHGVQEIALDGRALGVTGAAALLTALLFGVGPCFSIGTRVSGRALRAQGSGGVSPFWRRFRSVLLVGEIGITMILLAGATTLVSHVRRVMDVDTGARGERALAIELTLAGDKYRTADLRRAFFSRITAAVRSVPGVEQAGLSDQLPGRASELLLARPIRLDGQEPPTGIRQFAVRSTASPEYFAASGIDLLAGRTFSDRDVPGAPPVVIVSETYARRLGLEPAALIGARAGDPGDAADDSLLPAEEIVGVVRDVRLKGPEERFDPMVYTPLAVRPGTTGPVHLVVRVTGDPRSLVPALRAAVAQIDPDLPLFNINTFDEIRAALLAERRLAMTAMVVFAALAFTLSAIGLYSVINYLVQLRTRDIGIRLAIGATRERIRRQILAAGAAHAAIGVAIGTGATLALTGVVASKVPGMDRIDPVLLAGVAIAVVLAATLAASIPAWRATRIDPALTLRAD